MSNTTVNVNIISTRGHDVLELSPADALSEVTRQARDNAKWVFVNGDLVSDINSMTTDMLESASDITLANQLVGG